MDVVKSEFAGSFPSYTKCPPSKLPEYAFIGRSNVGKSSLINMLTKRKDLAHISKKPGKTQMINYYKINDSWNIVDLPGYGYAKLSKKHRKSLETMISGYMANRMEMLCAFVLIDIRISPQAIDIEFINWLGSKQVPFAIIFTKADKNKPEINEANKTAFFEELLKYWNDLPASFTTSSVSREGREEVLAYIEDINSQYGNEL